MLLMFCVSVASANDPEKNTKHKLKNLFNMDEFPHNLADLQKGDAVEGDSGVDATKPPSTSFLSIFSFFLLAFRLKHARRFRNRLVGREEVQSGSNDLQETSTEFCSYMAFLTCHGILCETLVGSFGVHRKQLHTSVVSEAIHQNVSVSRRVASVW